MASNIDPTIIDGQYPIAGKDQPSQGFRTNFTGIEENFSAAASEITELQEKAVLKAPLSGTTLDNNLQGNEILSAKMRDLLIPVAGINWSAGQVNSLDTLSGGYQTVLLNQSRPYAVTFNNFSRTFGKGASYSTVLLQVNNQGNNSIALQSGKNYVGLEKISYANPASKTLNFYSTNPTTVSNVVLSFSSADGNTFLVQDLSRDVSGLNYGVPVNFPQGRSGDKQGDIQVYQGNVYICILCTDVNKVISRSIKAMFTSVHRIIPPAVHPFGLLVPVVVAVAVVRRALEVRYSLLSAPAQDQHFHPMKILSFLLLDSLYLYLLSLPMLV